MPDKSVADSRVRSKCDLKNPRGLDRSLRVFQVRGTLHRVFRLSRIGLSRCRLFEIRSRNCRIARAAVPPSSCFQTLCTFLSNSEARSTSKEPIGSFFVSVSTYPSTTGTLHRVLVLWNDRDVSSVCVRFGLLESFNSDSRRSHVAFQKHARYICLAHLPVINPSREHSTEYCKSKALRLLDAGVRVLQSASQRGPVAKGDTDVRCSVSYLGRIGFPIWTFEWFKSPKGVPKHFRDLSRPFPIQRNVEYPQL